MAVGPLFSFRRFVPDLSLPWRWPRRMVGAGLAQALDERERSALWLPAGFGAGISIYFALAVEPSPLIALAIAAIGLAAAVSAVLVPHLAGRAALAVVAALSLGFAHAKLRAE